MVACNDLLQLAPEAILGRRRVRASNPLYGILYRRWVRLPLASARLSSVSTPLFTKFRRNPCSPCRQYVCIMIWLRIVSTTAVLALSGFASESVPPVLRTAEPMDNLIVTLPGAPAPVPETAKPAPVPPFPVATLGPVASTFPKLSIASEDAP